jgi:murein DD-endopeptidase MepM/ murein hydrolase activator NlpD
VAGRVMSRFGDRNDPFSGEGGFHTGVDISADMGTPLYAAADGVAFNAQYAGRYGRLIVIDHGNGLQTWYAHLSRFEVIPGEEIRRGQLIGYTGASGRVTAPHLHFEVRQGGSPVNPSRYLSQSTMLRQVRPDLPF